MDEDLWMIQAVIQPFKLDAVSFALQQVPGFGGMTVSDCRGYGHGKLTPGQDADSGAGDAKMKDTGLISDPRAQIILTYALCGFSNIASVGILIGGLGALAPNQRGTLAQLGLKALLGGSIACFLTACVASMLT